MPLAAALHPIHPSAIVCFLGGSLPQTPTPSSFPRQSQ